MKKLTRIVALFLSILLTIPTVTGNASAEELTTEEAYWENIELLSIYMRNDPEALVDIAALRLGFQSLHHYQLSTEFSLYAQIMEYLENDDLNNAMSWLSILVLYPEFDKFVTSEEFNRQYPEIRGLQEMETYINARREEMAHNYNAASTLYKSCLKFYDAMERYQNLYVDLDVVVAETLEQIKSGDYASAIANAEYLIANGHERGQALYDVAVSQRDTASITPAPIATATPTPVPPAVTDDDIVQPPITPTPTPITHNHSYKYVVTKAATCGETGIRTYTCSECGDSYTTTISKTDDHSYKYVVTKAATCGATGVKTYTCSKCGDSYTTTIPKTDDHSYKDAVTKAATCGATGVRTYTCSKCGDSYTATIPKTDDHSYKYVVTKSETCTETGVKTWTCSNCHHSYTESIQKKGHDYTSRETRSATCSTYGEITYTCSTCGYQRREDIPKTAHSNVVTVWGEPYDETWTIIDSEYHFYEAKVDNYDYCQDCKCQISPVRVGARYRQERHSFSNTVCWYCGYDYVFVMPCDSDGAGAYGGGAGAYGGGGGGFR